MPSASSEKSAKLGGVGGMPRGFADSVLKRNALKMSNAEVNAA